MIITRQDQMRGREQFRGVVETYNEKRDDFLIACNNCRTFEWGGSRNANAVRTDALRRGWRIMTATRQMCPECREKEAQHWEHSTMLARGMSRMTKRLPEP